MYKLTIEIDTYDDDFCFITNGAVVPERKEPIVVFGTSQEEVIANFLEKYHVGHWRALDRDHDWSKETGYHHVNYFRKMFHEELPRFVKNRSLRKCDTITGYGLRWNKDGFAFFHGGNQEFTVTMTNLGEITRDVLKQKLLDMEAKRIDMIEKLDLKFEAELRGMLQDYKATGGEEKQFHDIMRLLELPTIDPNAEPHFG